MSRYLPTLGVILAIVAVVLWDSFSNQSSPPTGSTIDVATLNPDWSVISAWPGSSEDTAGVDATPDPGRITTLIVFDDSTSMSNQIAAARQAVVTAVAGFAPENRVGVIALNAGGVIPIMPANEAFQILPARLEAVEANGATPLGRSLNAAADLLTQEAQLRRGFGVFRILVTTDGAASDEDMMNQVVAQIMSRTPIELATIGLGIGEGHALNLPGFTSYVSVANASELASALTNAAAEQTVFQPITSFED